MTRHRSKGSNRPGELETVAEAMERKCPWLAHMFAAEHPRQYAKMSIRRCGAHCKSTGKPCRARALENGRCKYHGGLSTGPKTVEGRKRALANLKQFRKRPLEPVSAQVPP
jgi:hypothetical protein